MSKIITESRYKPSEVIQLLSLLTMWGLLGNKMPKTRVGELKLEEWLKRVVNETRRIFHIQDIGYWEEKSLDREM